MIRTYLHRVNVNLVQLCEEGGLEEDLGGFYGIRGVGVKSYSTLPHIIELFLKILSEFGNFYLIKLFNPLVNMD